MNNYKDYPYNQVCFKASHNSYEKKVYGISITQQLDKDCRGLELDIAQSPDGKKWSVEHSPDYFADPEKQLARYLEELSLWSANNSNHDVITIHLDLKLVNDESDTSSLPEEIDSYIKDNFDREKIYCPGDLMGRKVSLAHGARSNGWPKLKDLDGKFIFCLTGNDVLSLKQLAKSNYAKIQPKQRLCFTDLKKKKSQKPNPGKRIYFNYDFSDELPPRSKIDKKNWTKIIQSFVSKDDAILRTYLLNDKKRWERALKSGFNILVTDEIDEPWAKVGKTPFKIL